MSSFLIIRQVGTNPLGHHHNEGAVIHVQPVGAANELIVAVSYEWAVNVLAQVWLVKSGHRLFPFEAEDICNDIIRISAG